MKRHWSFSFEKYNKYGFRLGCIESDFLGVTYTFYFVPIDPNNIVFFSEMVLLLHEDFGQTPTMITSDPRYPIVFKIELAI